MIKQNLSIKAETKAYWYIFSQNQILVAISDNKIPLCHWSELSFAHSYQHNVIQIGDRDGTPCMLVDMGHESVQSNVLTSISLRQYISDVDAELVSLAARAYQLSIFIRTHRYCGQCGNKMTNVGWELAMQCKQCGHRAYPRISPCIIVAIVKDKQLLLAQGKQHKEGLHSILAGFVESGETLEQGVHREVMEEVGVRIKNLRYIESQPWPFPHQLMCGFIAEHDSGDIAIDGREILAANWFDFGKLPKTPGPDTISGRLIDYAINGKNTD